MFATGQGGTPIRRARVCRVYLSVTCKTMLLPTGYVKASISALNDDGSIVVDAVSNGTDNGHRR